MPTWIDQALGGLDAQIARLNVAKEALLDLNGGASHSLPKTAHKPQLHKQHKEQHMSGPGKFKCKKPGCNRSFKHPSGASLHFTRVHTKAGREGAAKGSALGLKAARSHHKAESV